MAKWIIDPDHSSVAFSIRHMMIAYIRGQFKRPADCGLDRQRQDRPEQTDDPGVASKLAGIEPLDRTIINAWEDREFAAAVRAMGRKKLIMTALWTEACLTFPSLDAMREGMMSTRSSMLSAVRRSKRTGPHWSASSEQALNP
jgi:hypothetical protein